MNTTRALIAFLILVSPLASHAQSPELKVLQVEYDNQLSERVTGAYNEGLAKLDAGYLAGIDRVLASSKAAGDLEAALALEAEKKRVADKGPLPVNVEQAPKALKSLRGIYRTELARLAAQRASSTASSMASRPLSQPTTARRGVAPLASRTISAWISTSTGRVPSIAGNTAEPATG